MHEDFERCLRAVRSKDARFDGWFVTAVKSTKIYCRPSCPVRPPLAKNMSFYPTAAAAQLAGFRACKRCRPDASPGSPEWNVRSDTVGRAMRLIVDGTIDREGVSGLASRLGYSTRQLERLLTTELGAGPLSLARAQRAQTARTLIETTELAYADVAFAAGFSSIRQFNDTVREVFDESPTGLRSRARGRAVPTSPGTIALRLPFRRPFQADSLFGHLAATAVPGCEEIRDGAYRRVLSLPHGYGIVALAPADGHVACRLALDDVRDVPAAISRCRRLLDLDADPEAVVETLTLAPLLGPLVAKAPGRRIPGAVDEHELAIRVVLGQQVSTAAARALGARLVSRYGAPIVDPIGSLTHAFPPVEALVDLGLGAGQGLRLAAPEPELLASARGEVVSLPRPGRHQPGGPGMPTARLRCIARLAAALADGTIVLGPGCDRALARAQLASCTGVGPWSVEMIAMRALGDPDAFPSGDRGVRVAAERLGLPTSGPSLERHAFGWRPWRSYATQYLWSCLDHPVNNWPVNP